MIQWKKIPTLFLSCCFLLGACTLSLTACDVGGTSASSSDSSSSFDPSQEYPDLALEVKHQEELTIQDIKYSKVTETGGSVLRFHAKDLIGYLIRQADYEALAEPEEGLVYIINEYEEITLAIYTIEEIPMEQAIAIAVPWPSFPGLTPPSPICYLKIFISEHYQGGELQ